MYSEDEPIPMSVPEESFGFSIRRRMVFLLMGSAIGVFGCTAVFLIILFPDSIPSPRNRGQVVILGPVIALGGFYMLHVALMPKNLHAFTNSNGLTLIKDGEHQECRWEEIVCVRETGLVVMRTLLPLLKALPTGEEHQFILECHDGKILVLPNLLSNLRRLGTIVEDATLPYLLPPEQRGFDAVGSFDAGPLRVTDRGVYLVKEHQEGILLTFDEISEIKRERGSIVFRRSTLKKFLGMVVHDNSPAISTNDIPNPHLVLALIEKCRQAACAIP